MAIDKLPRKNGHVYRVRIVLPNGKRYSECFHRKVDAEICEATIRTSGDNSPYAKRRQARFKELADIFLKNHAQAGLSVASYKKYDAAIRLYLNPHFGNYWLDGISKLNVAEFKAKVIQLDRSDSLKNFVFSALKTMFRKAREWDLLESSPAEFEKPPQKGMSRIEYWTESEVKNFLSAMEDNPRLPIYLLALNTGMRVGEIFGLKWDCVDLENGMLTIKRILCQKSSTVKETTKTRKARQIGISETLRNVFLQLKVSSNSEFVIGFDGKRDTSRMSPIFAKDCRAAGVRVIKFHDLRHTFATQFVMNNGTIHALAGMMGHTSTGMTSRYAHFGPEHAKRAAQVVSFDVPKNAHVIALDQTRRKTSGSGQDLVTEH